MVVRPNPAVLTAYSRFLLILGITPGGTQGTIRDAKGRNRAGHVQINYFTPD